uniref:Ig-like domain-containing protein n=1 Tax=Anas platyrhynchos TaxID=8839 RepID=A0A8B9R572_ANAPL
MHRLSLPEVTLLYWLGNGSFIEKLHPDGAVHEGMLLEEPRGSGVVLRRDLLFSSFSARDLRTNFTCVVLSPVGLDTRELRWGPPQPAPTETAPSTALAGPWLAAEQGALTLPTPRSGGCCGGSLPSPRASALL